MYKIEFDLPLEKDSIVTFTINNDIYKCNLASSYGYFYISLIKDKFLKDGLDEKTIFHYNFVCRIFDDTLGKSAKDYYKEIFPYEGFNGTWPETSLKDLEKVLIKMQEDFEKLNKPSKKKPKLNFSRFRFRIGDTIVFRKKEYKIVGYYFSEGFNNFNESYGYVIEGYPDGHKGQSFSYNEFGEQSKYYPKEDKYYVNEKKAEISNKSITNQLKTIENGNEIKLPRTKTLVVRGEVPEGCRICSNVNKTAISIQSLSNTTISREG